jgi:hypothetical protein
MQMPLKFAPFAHAGVSSAEGRGLSFRGGFVQKSATFDIVS